jgi:hypothetical protein
VQADEIVGDAPLVAREVRGVQATRTDVVPAGAYGTWTSRSMMSRQMASGRRPSVATVCVATAW